MSLSERASDDQELTADPPWVHSLRSVDGALYQVEQRIVTLAALIMTVTVSLDILFRSLKGQQTEPMNMMMTLFGAFPFDVGSTKAVALPSAITPPLTLIVLSFGLGWAVYHARHRGEENTGRRSLKWGGFSLVGIYLFCVCIRQIPSAWVCGLISSIGGGMVCLSLYRSGKRVEVFVNATVILILTWMCTALPQDYIWSQELSLIMLAWVAFLGASMASYQNKHIQLSALSRVIPSSLKPWVRPISLLMTSLFSAYVATLLYMSVFGDKGSFYSGETRPATGIPAWVILTSGVISFSLIAIRSFAYSCYAFTHPHSPTETGELH